MKWEKTTKARIADELVDPDTLAPPEWQSWGELAWHLPRMLAGLGRLTFQPLAGPMPTAPSGLTSTSHIGGALSRDCSVSVGVIVSA